MLRRRNQHSLKKHWPFHIVHLKETAKKPKRLNRQPVILGSTPEVAETVFEHVFAGLSEELPTPFSLAPTSTEKKTYETKESNSFIMGEGFVHIFAIDLQCMQMDSNGKPSFVLFGLEKSRQDQYMQALIDVLTQQRAINATYHAVLCLQVQEMDTFAWQTEVPALQAAAKEFLSSYAGDQRAADALKSLTICMTASQDFMDPAVMLDGALGFGHKMQQLCMSHQALKQRKGPAGSFTVCYDAKGRPCDEDGLRLEAKNPRLQGVEHLGEQFAHLGPRERSASGGSNQLLDHFHKARPKSVLSS